MTQMKKIITDEGHNGSVHGGTRIHTEVVRENFFEEVFSELSSMDE